jgi:alpha(1,3/1,4) fucosyltransferase
MTRALRVAGVGWTPGPGWDTDHLVLAVLSRVAGRPIARSNIFRADLVLVGPFLGKVAGTVPRPLPFAIAAEGFYAVSPAVRRVLVALQSRPAGRRPLLLAVTGENTRWDEEVFDFSISMDLGVTDARHHRLPYWMQILDWSHEGVSHANPWQRFGAPIPIARLLAPLGDAFRTRPQAAAIFSRHQREPRRTLIEAVGQVMPVTGLGRGFGPSPFRRNARAGSKTEILRDFAYNLCPENSLYPGYYTEKVPDAFAAGSVPLGWADEHVAVDFNPDAFINLHGFASVGYANGLRAVLEDAVTLDRIAGAPLFREPPSLEPLAAFLHEVAASVR